MLQFSYVVELLYPSVYQDYIDMEKKFKNIVAPQEINLIDDTHEHARPSMPYESQSK